MKSTLSEFDFLDAWERSSRAGQFSRAALEAMFRHIEALEADTGEETELDIVALCCEYSEYASLEAAEEDTGSDIEALREKVVASGPGFVLLRNE